MNIVFSCLRIIFACFLITTFSAFSMSWGGRGTRDRLVRTAPPATQPAEPNSPAEFLDVGVAAFNAGNIDQAIQYFEIATGDATLKEIASINLGQAYTAKLSACAQHIQEDFVVRELHQLRDSLDKALLEHGTQPSQDQTKRLRNIQEIVQKRVVEMFSLRDKAIEHYRAARYLPGKNPLLEASACIGTGEAYLASAHPHLHWCYPNTEGTTEARELGLHWTRVSAIDTVSSLRSIRPGFESQALPPTRETDTGEVEYLIEEPNEFLNTSLLSYMRELPEECCTFVAQGLYTSSDIARAAQLLELAKHNKKIEPILEQEEENARLKQELVETQEAHAQVLKEHANILLSRIEELHASLEQQAQEKYKMQTRARLFGLWQQRLQEKREQEEQRAELQTQTLEGMHAFTQMEQNIREEALQRMAVEKWETYTQKRKWQRCMLQHCAAFECESVHAQPDSRISCEQHEATYVQSLEIWNQEQATNERRLQQNAFGKWRAYVQEKKLMRRANEYRATQLRRQALRALKNNVTQIQAQRALADEHHEHALLRKVLNIWQAEHTNAQERQEWEQCMQQHCAMFESDPITPRNDTDNDRLENIYEQNLWCWLEKERFKLLTDSSIGAALELGKLSRSPFVFGRWEIGPEE